MSWLSKNKDTEAPPPLPQGPEDEGSKVMTIGAMAAGVEGLPQGEDLEFHSMNPRKGLLGQGALLIVLVIIIAAAALWAMRVTQSDISAGPSKQTVEKIDKALGRMSGAPHDDSGFNAKEIESLLTADSGNHQVPLEFVKKNPFAMPVVKPVETPGAPAQPVVDHAAELALKNATAEVATMRLQTVMNGRVPMAVINDKVVKVGDKVGSLAVKSITGRGVELEAVGKTFFIGMETPEQRKN